jgi:hypothetical protein
MKNIRVIVEQKDINKLVGKEFNLFLYDEATVLDAIIKVDKSISFKGKFPLIEYKNRDDLKPKTYRSLLHIVYNPLANRMYDHIIMGAYSKSEPWIDVKHKPKSELPDGTKVTIILKTICGDIASETIIGYEILQQTTLREGYKIS